MREGVFTVMLVWGAHKKAPHPATIELMINKDYEREQECKMSRQAGAVKNLFFMIGVGCPAIKEGGHL